MKLIEKHIIRSNSKNYSECERVCHLSKNLYNYANYIVREEFISSSKDKQSGLVDHANYLNYYSLNKKFIKENQIDYISLPRKVSNQTLMLLDKNWKSFFKLCKSYAKQPNKFLGRPKMPGYLHKDGCYITTYELGAISSKYLKNNIVKLSGTDIEISTNKASCICECKIIPRSGYYIVAIVYDKQEKEMKPDNGRYFSIDLGVKNFATVASNVVSPFIIPGGPLKSMNSYYNKKKAHYQSRLEKCNKKRTSNRLIKLTNKRNNKIDDYLHKVSHYIVEEAIKNDVNTIVIGKNYNWKQNVNIGNKNNQNFVFIPHGRGIDKMLYKCKLNGISVILQEESYTSKCSFLDMEDICKHEIYKGNRIKRGLFISQPGKLINADVNGASNILRKGIPNIVLNDNEIKAMSVSPRIIKF